MIAANDVPMVFTVTNQKDNVVVQAAEAGAFWEIDKFINDSNRYPNLSKYNPGVQESVKISGKTYGLYCKVWLTRHGWSTGATG
jgi:putative aldouronate transport system substrate-binding protein